jgi:ABC-type dipeptide/oligopeptide/nickel transport system ATPase component
MYKRQGTGSATHWINGRNLTMRRYLNQFYPIYDWKNVAWFFSQNPVQARVILDDFSKTNDAKLKTVVNLFTDGKSKIIYIVGGRGSGKTATAFMIAEVSHNLRGQRVYYVGQDIDKKALPKWCVPVEHIKDAPNGCLAIIDESGIQFNAREYRDRGNIEMSKQLMIARHKDISLIFLTQHTALSDTNIQRLRDLVIWKMSNDYTPAEKGTARSREHQFWKKVRSMMSPRSQAECLFEYPMKKRFIHFTHPLPECWSEALSKTWKNRKFNSEKKKEAKQNEDLIKEMSINYKW